MSLTEWEKKGKLESSTERDEMKEKLQIRVLTIFFPELKKKGDLRSFYLAMGKKRGMEIEREEGNLRFKFSYRCFLIFTLEYSITYLEGGHLTNEEGFEKMKGELLAKIRAKRERKHFTTRKKETKWKR